MNCQEFWKTLPEPDAPHPHLAECPECAARMRRQRNLAGGLRAVADTLGYLQAPPRVEERVLAAFRQQSGGLPAAARGRRWIPAAAWAAALAAMIAIGVLVIRQRQPEATQPAPKGGMEVAMVEAPAVATGTDEEGFLPLPGAAQLAPAGDLDLVRVELPRSAMMQVGIEVSPERATETVQADVMVGPDGLARSVRFLEVSGSL